MGKYLLKNVKEPIEIFAVSNAGLSVPHNIKLEGKGEKYKEHKSKKSRIINLVKLGTVLLALVSVWFLLLNPWMKKQHAKNELMPAIQKMVADNFHPPTTAFDMALGGGKIFAKDSALIKMWPMLATKVTMNTEPSGAEVWWKDYDKPNSEWRLAGTTPLKQVRFPRPYLRLEIRKKGYQPVEYAGPGLYWRLWGDSAKFTLDKEGSLPANMARIPKKNTPMHIVGLESNGPKDVPEFLMDKYEVSNKQFKAFMDAGGYTNKNFWNNTIYSNEKEISLEAALALFVDKTEGPVRPIGSRHLS
jgi:hypothetical protein